VNDYGNAFLDPQGQFVKLRSAVPLMHVVEMVAYAQAQSLKAGDYKNSTFPLKTSSFGLPQPVRERMIQGVEDFAYHMMVEVFNAQDTAPLAIEAILKAGSHSPGPKARRIQKAADWTPEKIRERAASLQAEKGPREASTTDPNEFVRPKLSDSFWAFAAFSPKVLGRPVDNAHRRVTECRSPAIRCTTCLSATGKS